MGVCRLVVLLGALSLATGMRMKKASKAARTTYIAGIPVYNYKSPQSSDAAGLLEVQQEARDWILMLKSDVSDEQLESFCKLSSTTCTPEGHAGVVPFVVIHGTEKDLKQMLEAHSDIVTFAEPEFEMAIIPEVPEDADGSLLEASTSSTPWGLDKVGRSQAGTRGRGVHVYVLDTGVRTTHSDFGGRAIPTLEVTSSRPQECGGSTSCARDVHGHGTHCAGTVAGEKYGVAPGATIHGVKVLSDSGSGSGSWSVAAIDWVVSKGERPAVMSMSLGARGTSYADKVAIDAATKAGVTVVVAAGNENDDACGYSPAYVTSAITVGSTDSRDRRSSFSNYGRCVNIYAPGSSITSAGHRSDSESATMSGTSMACPHVSGAAALLLESNSNLNSDQVLASMHNTAKSGVISGLTSSDPNKLLWVGSGSAPAPSPTPAPTPAPWQPTPAPTPSSGSCHSVCDRASDCTSYPSICSGCSFCFAPTPSPSPPPSSGSCHDVCDHPNDCTDYAIICSGCSFCY